MRFSGSIYDNLRQPGVFNEIEHEVGYDKEDEKKKKVVLARLRFDDLLANDSLEDSNPRIVMSFTDILDGRLFTLFTPQELDGIELEICAPKIIANNPKSAVINTVRGWIQKLDGKGWPCWFMAARGGYDSVYIADLIEKRNDLNVNSLKNAFEVVKEAGLQKEHAEELMMHWYRWDEAISKGIFKLTPFPRNSASAVDSLNSFLANNENDLWHYGIGDNGARMFREALKYLEDSGGKRDKPVRFLLEQQSSTQDDLKREVEAVMGIFFYYMFETIVHGNNALPEHSAEVGEKDKWALSVENLKRLDSFEEGLHEVMLDTRIVSKLGKLPASEYKSIKNSLAQDIRFSIEHLKQTAKQSKKGQGDVSKLKETFEKWTKDIGKDSDDAKKGIPAAFRRIILPISSSLISTTLHILLSPSVDPMTAAIAVGGAAGGEIVRETAKGVIPYVQNRLFTNSIVNNMSKRINTFNKSK